MLSLSEKSKRLVPANEKIVSLLILLLLTTSRMTTVKSDDTDQQSSPELPIGGGEVHIVLAPCSVCRDGQSIGLPENTGVLPGVPGEFTCQQLDIFLPALYPNSSHPDCQAIQSVGALCGCTTPSDACTICNDNAPMAYPKRPLEFFQDLFGGSSRVVSYSMPSYKPPTLKRKRRAQALRVFCQTIVVG
jgi:hypothetical protein